MSRLFLYRRLKHDAFRSSVDRPSPAGEISRTLERAMMLEYLVRALDARARDNEEFLIAAHHALLDRSQSPRVRAARRA